MDITRKVGHGPNISPAEIEFLSVKLYRDIFSSKTQGFELRINPEIIEHGEILGFVQNSLEEMVSFSQRLFFPTTLCGVLVFNSVSRSSSSSRLLPHHLSHISHTIYHTPSSNHLHIPSLHTPSFTHHLSHTISQTPSSNHHLCQQPSFTHHLCHTNNLTTNLCHIICVNHHFSHTSSSNHLCPPSLSTIFVNHHL